MANQLADAHSLYLRQHADNPVDWRQFGEGAFAEAAARDVPVFLSIGYAACHWCHVMAHESFEDAATAEYLNAHFVAIKVDREERPDVDSTYMAATQAITGAGGWPMSVFATPAGRPFHAGMYFPPHPAPGQPAFRQVLEAVVEAWTGRRDAVETSAEALSTNIARAQHANRQLLGDLTTAPAGTFVDTIDAAVESLASQEDRDYGGFGGAPKFPPSTTLEFLLHRAAGVDAPAATAAALSGRTLTAMAHSALNDQVAGGFARYTVDRRWSVPHFEKMLYDNAQLLRLYARWSRVQGDHQPMARRVAGSTADWLLGQLQLPDGGIASSLDADTVVDGVHHEGATYLYSLDELRGLLGADADADAVARFMHVGEAGTVTDTGSALDPAGELSDADAETWARARPILVEDRRRRPAPTRDEKVVAGWNGLAIAALADAGAILGRNELLTAAERCADYLWNTHVYLRNSGGTGDGTGTDGSDDGPDASLRLRRVSFAGQGRGIDGLLEDYAFCARGFFALYAATGRVHWYERAERLLGSAEALFVADGTVRDSHGADDGPEDVGPGNRIANARGGADAVDPLDNVTASGAAALASALLAHGAYSGDAERRRLALSLIGHVRQLASAAPRAVGAALAVAVEAESGPVQVAIVGPATAERDALAAVVVAHPAPGLVLAVSESGDGVVPLLASRTAADDGGALAYVCRGMVCDRPVSEPGQLRQRLDAAMAPRPS